MGVRNMSSMSLTADLEVSLASMHPSEPTRTVPQLRQSTLQFPKLSREAAADQSHREFADIKHESAIIRQKEARRKSRLEERRKEYERDCKAWYRFRKWNGLLPSHGSGPSMDTMVTLLADPTTTPSTAAPSASAMTPSATLPPISLTVTPSAIATATSSVTATQTVGPSVTLATTPSATLAVTPSASALAVT